MVNILDLKRKKNKFNKIGEKNNKLFEGKKPASIHRFVSEGNSKTCYEMLKKSNIGEPLKTVFAKRRII